MSDGATRDENDPYDFDTILLMLNCEDTNDLRTNLAVVADYCEERVNPIATIVRKAYEHFDCCRCFVYGLRWILELNLRPYISHHLEGDDTLDILTGEKIMYRWHDLTAIMWHDLTLEGAKVFETYGPSLIGLSVYVEIPDLYKHTGGFAQFDTIQEAYTKLLMAWSMAHRTYGV